ncbi:MAG: hypothetical protein HY392_00160 [Candidatus Diapherotrites archaeon]|nr:hypothetical protein [Candidatus Diapherotrites archaeon]
MILLLSASVFAVALPGNGLQQAQYAKPTSVKAVSNTSAQTGNTFALATGSAITVYGYADNGDTYTVTETEGNAPIGTTAAGSTGAEDTDLRVQAPKRIIADKLISVSITGNKQKILAESETLSGMVLKEIPASEVSSVVYNDVTITSVTGSSNVALAQGSATAETSNTVEINGSLYIKSSEGKQKITILPAQAISIISETFSGQGIPIGYTASGAEPNELSDFATATATPRVQQATQAESISGSTQTAAGEEKAFSGLSATQQYDSLSAVSLGIEGNTAVYKLTATKKGKFLGIVPVEFPVTVKVNAQTATETVEKPFWSVFVFG